MKKPINKNKINDYMLYRDGRDFYLIKYNGEVQITVERAKEWNDAGISLFEETREQITKAINEIIDTHKIMDRR